MKLFAQQKVDFILYTAKFEQATWPQWRRFSTLQKIKKICKNLCKLEKLASTDRKDIF